MAAPATALLDIMLVEMPNIIGEDPARHEAYNTAFRNLQMFNFRTTADASYMWGFQVARWNRNDPTYSLDPIFQNN